MGMERGLTAIAILNLLQQSGAFLTPGLSLTVGTLYVRDSVANQVPATVSLQLHSVSQGR